MPPYVITVDPAGFEPATFSMPLRRAPKLRYGPNDDSCGPGGIRTRDLFSAIEARSQLRYRPAQWTHCTCFGRACQVILAVLYLLCNCAQLNSVSVEALVARMPERAHTDMCVGKPVSRKASPALSRNCRLVG